jgi:hypothetical protein
MPYLRGRFDGGEDGQVRSRLRGPGTVAHDPGKQTEKVTDGNDETNR